jgi:hypothetical protein
MSETRMLWCGDCHAALRESIAIHDLVEPGSWLSVSYWECGVCNNGMPEHAVLRADLAILRLLVGIREGARAAEWAEYTRAMDDDRDLPT